MFGAQDAFGVQTLHTVVCSCWELGMGTSNSAIVPRGCGRLALFLPMSAFVRVSDAGGACEV